MMWEDSMQIVIKNGSCSHDKVKQRVYESEPNVVPTQEMLDEAKKYRGKSYFTSINRDIDTIAQMIEQQGACLLWFWFDEAGREWWRVEPRIRYSDLGTYDRGATRHAVTAVDYGLRNGKKVIVIEDSAGNNTAEDSQRRYIDEAFLKRCFIAGYVVDMPTPKQQDNKPKFTFTRSLKVGSRGKDVQKLQECLIYEGCLSLPYAPTEYFGGMTRAGVVRFQEKYTQETLAPWGLTKGTGFAGSTTIAQLNKLFG